MRGMSLQRTMPNNSMLVLGPRRRACAWPWERRWRRSNSIAVTGNWFSTLKRTCICNISWDWKTFHKDCPFDDSSLTNFRKYLGEGVLCQVNEAVVAKMERLQANQQQGDKSDPPSGKSGKDRHDERGEDARPLPKRKHHQKPAASVPLQASWWLKPPVLQLTLLTRSMCDCLTRPACRARPW